MEKWNQAAKQRKYGKKDSWKQESTETRKFEGEMKPLMSEDEKKDAQVLELSYDFRSLVLLLWYQIDGGRFPSCVTENQLCY